MKLDIPDLADRNEAARLWEKNYHLFNEDDERADAALKAFEDLGVDLSIDELGEGKAVRCAISGVPIIETDETAIVLKAALRK